MTPTIPTPYWARPSRCRRSASASSRDAPEQTVDAVEAALAVGYRQIDTAAAYGNERELREEN